MALIWLGLNGADWSSWIVGGPVVFAAAWISVKLLPAIPWHWSVGGAIAFAGWFLRESLRGGWDVARRALSPKLALSPAIVCVPFHLPSGAARLFFCSAISLLPGTAVVAIAEEQPLRPCAGFLAARRGGTARTGGPRGRVVRAGAPGAKGGGVVSVLYISAAVALLLTIVLGLGHVFRQPGRADSLLAALLFGSTGVALVLVLGKGLGLDRALDIALVFALLAAVLGVAFVLRGWPDDDPKEDPKP